MALSLHTEAGRTPKDPNPWAPSLGSRQPEPLLPTVGLRTPHWKTIEWTLKTTGLLEENTLPGGQDVRV